MFELRVQVLALFRVFTLNSIFRPHLLKKTMACDLLESEPKGIFFSALFRLSGWIRSLIYFLLLDRSV